MLIVRIFKKRLRMSKPGNRRCLYNMKHCERVIALYSVGYVSELCDCLLAGSHTLNNFVIIMFLLINSNIFSLPSKKIIH